MDWTKNKVMKQWNCIYINKLLYRIPRSFDPAMCYSSNLCSFHEVKPLQFLSTFVKYTNEFPVPRKYDNGDDVGMVYRSKFKLFLFFEVLLFIRTAFCLLNICPDKIVMLFINMQKCHVFSLSSWVIHLSPVLGCSPFYYTILDWVFI